jgi:hypothetical protein
MAPAFRVASSAALSIVLGAVSPLIAYWLSASTIVAVAMVFSWTGHDIIIGIALWWILTILGCSLPIAAVAKQRAPWFGVAAGAVVVMLAAATTEPFGGSAPLSDPVIVTTIVIAAVVFPLASYLWWRMLSMWQRARS